MSAEIDVALKFPTLLSLIDFQKTTQKYEVDVSRCMIRGFLSKQDIELAISKHQAKVVAYSANN